jgi:uncharacterized protein (DUF488 family)
MTVPTVPCIHSVGYQGRSLGELVADLERRGVRVLVDVRQTPISRKPGFSRRALCAGLGDVGIEYVHEPDLGNPKQNRAAFVRGDFAARALLRSRLESSPGRSALKRLLERARREPVAVLCFEQSPEQCHRRLVTALLSEMEPTLEVIDAFGEAPESSAPETRRPTS